jgi:tetratricopeptide (TPR) repeat protein
MLYEDFVIRISSGSAGVYAVQIQSPAGQGHGVFSIPASLAGRPSRPVIPGDRNLGLQVSGDPSRRDSDRSSRQAGTDLFRALFVDEVLGLFRASLAGLPSEEHGLRIRLELNPREPGLAPLHDLPWELLCRPETEDFLGLSRHTPIVRFLDAHRERRPAIPLPPRLRILAVAESPADAPSLEVERELHDLEAAWRGLDSRVEIVRPEGRGREALHRAFLASTIHVLHFMGHGVFEEWTGEGALLFEGEDGAAFPVSGRGLAQELKGFRSLRFVVLNACHTAQAVGERGPNPFAGVATALVMEGVPAVVAMRRPISDAAALAFGRTLYERLAAGDPVDTAVAEARLAIHRLDETSGEWSTPVLFLRSDGLFAPRAPRRWIGGAALVLAIALAAVLSMGWLRDHRASKALRLNHEGLVQLDQEEDEAARQAFDAALALDAENAAAHANLSFLESQAGHYEEALVHARAAVAAEPEEAVHHYNLGHLLALMGRDEQALESLYRAVALDVGYAPAFNELGNVYLHLDRPAEAEEALRDGLRADPGLAPLHKNFARVALARGRIDDALQSLEAALALGTGDFWIAAEIHYWFAVAQDRAQRPAEACRHLEELRRMDPAGVGPWTAGAAALARQSSCAGSSS